MADDPPKKEVPTEVVIPSAPSTTRGAIRYTNTITRKQFAQLSGAEPPQICAEASKAENDARTLLNKDKTDRWLYLVAAGQLELEILLQIRYWERYGRRWKYSAPGLKGSDVELASFFGTTRPSVCRARNALMRRGSSSPLTEC
ncbi:MAG: hypothetical protein UE667_04445 [Collinsella sp.]|nr:hypothetical protein [Collinsella sp.]